MSKIYEEVDAAYAVVCSDATICSNPKGFFKSFADEMVFLSKENGWLYERFAKVRGENDKLKCLLENSEVSNAIDDVLSRVVALNRAKDARESHEKRLTASKMLSAGDLTKALALASQAVLRAPMAEENDAIDNGVSLALGLWLRSEILLKMKKYALALEDLKLALKERLPVKMRAVYYWRMGNCYKVSKTYDSPKNLLKEHWDSTLLGVGEVTRAKVSYELAHRLLKDQGDRDRLNEDIASLNNLSPVPESKESPKEEITLAAGAKTNVPSLSNFVKIVEEENKGRFAAANGDIKTGDVLLIESPYVACLLPDCYGTHCLHCFKRLEAPVWCPKCSAVAFCTTPCRDEALETYHKYECPFIDFFIGSGMSILSHIALRMVTQAGLDASLAIHAKYVTNETKTVDSLVVNDIEGISKKSKLKSRKEKLNRNKKPAKGHVTNETDNDVKLGAEIVSFKEKLELNSSQIYSLCTHSDVRKPEDYLKRILMAMFLTECLKKSGFFSRNGAGDIVKMVGLEFHSQYLHLNQEWNIERDRELDPERNRYSERTGKPELFAASTQAKLQDSNYLFQLKIMEFSSTMSTEETTNINSLTELLCRNLQLLQFNAHEIYETIRSGHKFSGARTHHIAVGVYPTGALFNHECYPAVARYFCGKRIILRAIRPLAPGEVVAENYGPHFLMKGLQERRRALACRYWFSCRCIACTEDWPDLKRMKSDKIFFIRCPNDECTYKFKGDVKNYPKKCPACHSPIRKEIMITRSEQVEQSVQKYQLGAKLMEEEKTFEAITCICNGVDNFSKCGAPPHHETHIAQEALRSCFAASGNVFSAPTAES